MKALTILTTALTILGILAIIFAFLFYASMFVFFLWMSETESQIYISYPTLRAAAEEGDIGDYRTLPPFLPLSTNDIRYIVFFETSEKWLSFNFDPGEISKIRNSCDRVTEGEVELPSEPPLNLIAWPPGNVDWPEEITAGDAPVRAEDIADYEFYKCKHGMRKVALAVDTEKGKAYYWTHELRVESGERAESVFYHNSYPTYSAAAAANAVGKGRDLPAFIPPSANDIRSIQFTGGSPDMWLSFNFNIEEISEIHKRCNRVVEGKVWPTPPPGNFIHWPREITPKPITGTVRAEDIPGYEFYRCEYGTREESLLGINTGILSVDTEKGKAYYWGI